MLGLGLVIGGAEGPASPIFNISAHLPNISTARQRCIVGKTQRKSYLLENWARTKPVYRQIGAMHSTAIFSSFPLLLGFGNGKISITSQEIFTPHPLP